MTYFIRYVSDVEPLLVTALYQSRERQSNSMAPGISYDDQGSLASYFAITFLSLILIPSTIIYLKPSKDAGPFVRAAAAPAGKQ